MFQIDRAISENIMYYDEQFNTNVFMNNCEGNFLTDKEQQQSNGNLCDGVSQ